MYLYIAPSKINESDNLQQFKINCSIEIFDFSVDEIHEVTEISKYIGKYEKCFEHLDMTLAFVSTC